MPSKNTRIISEVSPSSFITVSQNFDQTFLQDLMKFRRNNRKIFEKRKLHFKIFKIAEGFSVRSATLREKARKDY